MDEIEDFLSFRDYVRSLKTKDIERKVELGAGLAFSRAPKTVENLDRLLSAFSGDMAAVAPRDTWTSVRSACENFRSIMSGILNFNINNQNNSAAQKIALEAQLEDSYGQIFRSLAPIVSALNVVDGNSSLDNRISQFVISANDAISKAEKSLAKTNEEAKRKNVILDEILQAAQDKAGETVSTVEAEHFGTASEGYRDASKLWLLATAGLGALLFALAMLSFHWAESGRYSGMDTVSVTQLALSKLLIFAIVAYAINICSRNYFANKHNEAVNKHRKNAILSYRALIAPTSSPENRDIILVHAASAVFAPQDSAYTKQQSANVEIPPTFLASLAKTGG